MPTKTTPVASTTPMEVDEGQDAEKKQLDLKTNLSAQKLYDKVVVHPLVLLSVVDHFSRMSKTGNVKRVVGLLLGTVRNGVVDVSNSFGIPFDEDLKNPSVFFLDHDYLENMFLMFKKVAAKEKIVGWYHSGPKLKSNDLEITDIVKKFCSNPILVVCDVKPKHVGLPTEAYCVVEEVHDDGTPTMRSFRNIASEIDAEEAEEVGVEHLLRDIKDNTIGTLSQKVTNQVAGLKGLNHQLTHIYQYLEMVIKGDMKLKNEIVYLLQDLLNLLPDVTQIDFTNALQVSTNDEMFAIYLSTLVRAIIAMHNLIDNQLTNQKKDAEAAADNSSNNNADGEKDKEADKKDATKGQEKSDKTPNGNEVSSSKKEMNGKK